MAHSKNIEVQRFLDQVSLIDESKYNLVKNMRDIVFKLNRNIEERMMYGGIMFSLDEEDICGLFVRKNHISFEFATGYKMNDPHEILEGSGKYRRHLKIRTEEDVLKKDVQFFVLQVV